MPNYKLIEGRRPGRGAPWPERGELAERRGAPHSNWATREGRIPQGEVVIFDIDGVLADASARQHFLKGVRPDWDAFFANCHEDPLIEEAARLLHVVDGRYSIVLMTGRPVSVMELTIGWLNRYELRWDLLIMRDYGDYTAARHFKARETGRIRQAGLTPVLAFEDDLRNVNMFQADGIPCVYLHSGYY